MKNDQGRASLVRQNSDEQVAYLNRSMLKMQRDTMPIQLNASILGKGMEQETTQPGTSLVPARIECDVKFLTVVLLGLAGVERTIAIVDAVIDITRSQVCWMLDA